MNSAQPAQGRELATEELVRSRGQSGVFTVAVAVTSAFLSSAKRLLRTDCAVRHLLSAADPQASS